MIIPKQDGRNYLLGGVAMGEVPVDFHETMCSFELRMCFFRHQCSQLDSGSC